jgi:hypothetical protein
MPKDSLPELELRTVRTREALTDSVAEIKRRANVPARLRLGAARARQRMHRDPTPLVAMMVTAGAGVAAIVIGTRIGRTRAGHLEAAADPMLLPVFKPPKPGKNGTTKGKAAFARKPDKLNPTVDSKPYKKQQKKQRKRLAKQLRKH